MLYFLNTLNYLHMLLLRQLLAAIITNFMQTNFAEFIRTMFTRCLVIILALVISASVTEAHVLPAPGPGSSDVCHIAQSHSSSLHSLIALCDGISSSASGKFQFYLLDFISQISKILDQCTIPTVEILKPCIQGGLMDASCSRNSILQVVSMLYLHC